MKLLVHTLVFLIVLTITLMLQSLLLFIIDLHLGMYLKALHLILILISHWIKILSRVLLLRVLEIVHLHLLIHCNGYLLREWGLRLLLILYLLRLIAVLLLLLQDIPQLLLLLLL